MERDELRTTLVNHLETLRRNLQVVSMEVLKTKYKKHYDCPAGKTICKSRYRLYPLSGIRRYADQTQIL